MEMWARIDFFREAIDVHCGFDGAVTAAVPASAAVPAKGSTAMYERWTVLVSPSLDGGKEKRNSCQYKTLNDIAKADGGSCHLAKHGIIYFFFILNNVHVG